MSIKANPHPDGAGRWRGVQMLAGVPRRTREGLGRAGGSWGARPAGGLALKESGQPFKQRLPRVVGSSGLIGLGHDLTLG